MFFFFVFVFVAAVVAVVAVDGYFGVVVTAALLLFGMLSMPLRCCQAGSFSSVLENKEESERCECSDDGRDTGAPLQKHQVPVTF